MKPHMAVKKGLMDVFACPADKGQLVLVKSETLLKCRKCGKTYEVKGFLSLSDFIVFL